MIESLLRAIERFIPTRLYRFFQPAYHFLLAFVGALRYGFPSRSITVIFVTGTKGKSSTAELINNIFEAAGYNTALLGTIRFKVGEKSERNLRKMTIPGRFFVQKFLRDAVTAGCSHAIIEMTSEGAKQYRHRFIDADALVFTNLAPEHIESHGSFEAYRDAKLSIARALAQSGKPHHLMIANADDETGIMFLAIPGLEPIPYSRKDGEPIQATDHGVTLSFHATIMSAQLPGMFNAYNMLAAATCAHAFGIKNELIAKGIAQTRVIPGRMERVECGQSFPVVVDYAHTPDSLRQAYEAFAHTENICVLGNTGGGRDTWKRPVMGEIADKHCAHIILTNEDPYDEDPEAILHAMAEGIKNHAPEIIIDRREAIASAIAHAEQIGTNAAVLITGKGTDPYIMGPKGMKTPWDDRDVAREELTKALNK